MTDLPLEIQVPQLPQSATAVMGDRFHTEFYQKPIEDRQASMQSGHKVYKDEDWVIITLPGAKDCHHAPVAKKLEEWEFGVWQGQSMVKPPAPWAIHAYRKWKAGQEIPENGVPIKTWVQTSPAFTKTALAIGVRTVEDLASLNDDGMKRLGPGALDWKRRAIYYLQDAEEHKHVERLAALEAERDDLRATVLELQATANQMGEQIKQLAAGQMPQTVVSVPQVHVPEPWPPQNTTGTPLPPQTVTTMQSPDLELDSLRAEYKAVIGRKPPHFMKAETMRKRISEAQAQ